MSEQPLFKKFICRACGHLYDEVLGEPDAGIAAGTRFEAVRADWQCPLCGVPKSDFEPFESAQTLMTTDSTKRGVVVLGAGLAGWAVVDALRALDKEVAITLISADSADRYHKPMLSVAISQGKSRKDLVRTSGKQSAKDCAITLLAHTQVTGIDVDKRVLFSSAGVVAYDKLVLAMGATPICPPTIKDAWHVNHLDEFDRLQQRLSTPKTIAIIGAGMVGVELAEDLTNANHQVSLIDINAYPLSVMLPKVAGERILSALTNKGVRWFGSGTVERVSATDTAYQLTINQVANGDNQTDNQTVHLSADEIIIATGLHVDEVLPTQAGMAFDKRTGIVVDEKTLQTSVPDIYALGDCISIDGVPCRYVAPHRPQATAIAHQVLGLPDAGYTHKPPMIRLKNKCINLTANGNPVGTGDWHIIKDEDGELSLQMIKEGEVAAKALIKG